MQEKIREIKHLFMTYRNGAVADSLRQAGITCYRIVFGLNVPQIAEIARRNEKSMELAEWLWADNKRPEYKLVFYAVAHKQCYANKHYNKCYRD